MPKPTPPYQFIAIARTIARGFTEQAIGPPDGEALTEAARAIWRGIEVLEGMDRRALTERGPLRAAGAVSGTGPRSLIDPTRPQGRTVGWDCQRTAPPRRHRRWGRTMINTAVEDPERVARRTGAARAVSPAALCRLPA